MAVETDPAEMLMPGQRPHDILDTRRFSKEWLEQDLFPKAHEMEQMLIETNNVGDNSLADKRILILFYEASSRTSVSSASAAELLGARVTRIDNAHVYSSASKGESVVDTARTFAKYRFHCMVIRHDQEGGAAKAAEAVNVPVINGGDGPGQHPTQAFLDLFTVQEQFGQIAGLNFGIIGDLYKGRTTHSLAYLAAKFPKVRFNFVSTPERRMPQGIKDYLDRHNVKYQEREDLHEVLKETDVNYITRFQKERYTDSEQEPDNGDTPELRKAKTTFKFLTKIVGEERALELLPEVIAKQGHILSDADEQALRGHLKSLNGDPAKNIDQLGGSYYKIGEEELSLMPAHARVMHPLPRVDEIPQEIHDLTDPRVIIFRQVENGLFVRMALYSLQLG